MEESSVDVDVLSAPSLPVSNGLSKIRPEVRGKFFFLNDEKLDLKGLTYGPFAPRPDGSEYHDEARVTEDFRRMRAIGANLIRTYTVPPDWMLDIARGHGLYLLVGLPWTQHVAFLEESDQRKAIEQQVRKGVRACAGHPAVLAYAIGNELPPSIVRWYGHRRVAQFLRQLDQIVREEDEDALVTYVNFPTTEYLQLPFLDFVSFNVYLEDLDRLDEYLAHLHHRAGDRPLLLAEIGLDSHRNGLEEQARALNQQVEHVFRSGAAGAVVFSWTDEWFRGGKEITDWAFGLTTRDRSPKPALEAVQKAFARTPTAESLREASDGDRNVPLISVIVCSYNGGATLEETLAHVCALRYPTYEVIVVDDGSTDRTPEIASRSPVRHIRTENRGLSSARNTGWQTARGEIVVYLDDDAYPNPDWLGYIAAAFRDHGYGALGGPSLPPPDIPWVAEAIGLAPGNPKAVITTEREAEHVPGCNMAFSRNLLEQIGGFDTQFRIAGDDVDLCWRVLAAGKTIGYHAGAAVWHHPRSTVGGFLKQQRNYGRAEAMLEAKWPSRHNLLGHSRWNGRLYADARSEEGLLGRRQVYFGAWGQAPFQPMYEPAAGLLDSLARMPEWYLLTAVLGLVAASGLLIDGLGFAAGIFAVAAGLPLLHATLYAGRRVVASGPRLRPSHLRQFFLVAFLYLAQPIARLTGRLQQGLAPWRRFTTEEERVAWHRFWPREPSYWSESWGSIPDRLEALISRLERRRKLIERGGAYDRWDLDVRAGPFGTGRLLMAIEEHGDGRQSIRLRLRPRPAPWTLGFAILTGILAGILAVQGTYLGAALLGGIVLLFLSGMARDCGTALDAVDHCAQELWGEPLS